MSLARISQRLAAARQSTETAENRKDEEIEDLRTPHISLSPQWQTSGSMSEKDAKPLPLEALGSLLFSLSGFMLSTTREYFNVSQLDRCPQVLLVVIENMSTLDLEEKPNLLGRFRESAKRSGLSAVMMPAVAASNSTGSDLSQVRLNFQKDTSIIKHLLRETSGVRKLKTYDEDQRRKTSYGGADNINVEDFDSGTESLADTVSEQTTVDPTQRLRDFQLEFPQRHVSKLKQRLRSASQDAAGEPLNKQPKLDTEEENKPGNSASGLGVDSATSLKSVDSTKLRELKKVLVDIQRKLKNLRERQPKDEDRKREARKKAVKLRRDFRYKKQEYELERAKCIQGTASKRTSAKPKKTVSAAKQEEMEVNGEVSHSSPNRQECGVEKAECIQDGTSGEQDPESPKTKEKTNDGDLLKMLQKIKARSGLTLTPVGTVIEPGNLDTSKPERFDRTLLLLSPSEMKTQGFVLNYKPSRKSYTPVHSKSKLFGIDCEMCMTTRMANELTRVTVVNEDGVVLMDRLVKPRARIINYLTQFSGITPEMMQGVTTRKEAVLKELAKILPSDGILVGHSLESDLKALEITHPYCIDTSVCYSVKGSRQKSKLKVLMKTFLGEDIQVAGAAGHCSAEDSYSSLKLVLLKLQNDISFGDVDMKGDLEWNGVNYEDALKEALRVLARERVQQGPYRNIWVRPDKRTWQAPTRVSGSACSSVRNRNPIAKMGSHPSKDGDFFRRKRELDRLTKERKRQERAMRDIKVSLNFGESSSEAIAKKIMTEARMRRKREYRARKEKSEVDTILLGKLDEMENRKKELLSALSRTSNLHTDPQSLMVLQAKQKFLKQKLLDLEGAPVTSHQAYKNRRAMKKQLQQDLAKLEVQIEDRVKDETGLPDVVQAKDVEEEAEASEGDDESSVGDSEETDSKTNDSPPTETEVLGTLAENEAALEQLRRDEEILREELARAAQASRRAFIETKVAAQQEHNEILARKIVNGLADAEDVFRDEKRLHSFLEYQLFVLKKNEEYIRKRGKTFGTVALDRLYLDMFTAWKSAGKKSVVVGDMDVAQMNYDRVEIRTPEDGSLSSSVKAVRKCLKTHELVVSHLTYDDVNENDASIEGALDLLWERVKPAGVMIVLLEGTYHFKRLGHGLTLLSVKSCKSV